MRQSSHKQDRRSTHSLGWLDPLLVILLTPFILLPGRLLPYSLHPILVCALLAGWPIRLLLYGRLTRRTPMDWALAFLLIGLPLNFLVAADRESAWIALGYLLLGISAYLALINWQVSRRHPSLIAWGILTAGAGLSLVGFALLPVEQIPFPPLAALHLRLAPIATLLGESINANVLAGNLALTVPLAFALALGRGTHPLTRFIAGLFCLGVTLELAFTGSRGAVLAEFVGLLTVLAVRFPRLGIGILSAGLVSLGGLLWYGPARLLERVMVNDALGGLEGRLEIYTRSLFALQDFAFSGVGIGNFKTVVPLLYPATILADGGIAHAHNIFLQVGLDLGLPGLIAWVAIQICAIAYIIRILRRGTDLQHVDFAIGALGALTTIYVHGLADAVTWGTKLAFFPWLLLALVAVLRRSGGR